MVYFTENPDPPQGDVFRYRVGRLRVMLPDGRQRYLNIGNVSWFQRAFHFVDAISHLSSSVVNTLALHKLYWIRVLLAF
jgi:hypothetical protein